MHGWAALKCGPRVDGDGDWLAREAAAPPGDLGRVLMPGPAVGLVRRRMGAVTLQHTDEATATAWAALGGAPELAAQVAYRGPAGGLPSGLPVRELARA